MGRHNTKPILPCFNKQDDIDRFNSKIDKTSTPNGCHEWKAWITKNGDGRFTTEGPRQPDGSRGPRQKVMAPRAAVTLEEGVEIKPGTTVSHTCLNNACCNPKHIIADMEPKPEGFIPRKYEVASDVDVYEMVVEENGDVKLVI